MVALGLEQVAAAQRAQLADGAVRRAGQHPLAVGDGAGAVFQRAGEEGVEIFEAVRVFDFRFAEVHPEVLDEAVDEGGFDPGNLAARHPAHQAGQEVLGDDVLKRDKQLFF